MQSKANGIKNKVVAVGEIATRMLAGGAALAAGIAGTAAKRIVGNESAGSTAKLGNWGVDQANKAVEKYRGLMHK